MQTYKPGQHWECPKCNTSLVLREDFPFEEDFYGDPKDSAMYQECKTCGHEQAFRVHWVAELTPISTDEAEEILGVDSSDDEDEDDDWDTEGEV